MGVLQNRPPGPSGGLFGLSNARRMQENLLQFSVDLAREHGDCVFYSVANIPVFQFTHPEQAHEVLVAQNKSFQKPKRMREVLGQWNGNGLVLNEGESWVRQRRLVSPAFRAQELRIHSEAIVRRARRALDAWSGRGEVDIATELGRFTLGVVGEALYGADVERYEERFLEEVAVLNEAAMREMTAPVVLPMWAPVPTKRRMKKAVDFLKGVAEGMIAERRRSGGGRGDLLSLLLSAVDEEGDGGRMTDEQARDECINLFLGGNETTATGLTWAAYLLSKDITTQDAIAAELSGALGGGDPTFEGLGRLRAAEMAFKEAMRMYPPAYIITREAIADVTIGGYSIPRGATVQLSPFITQRDARFFEDPLVFRPSRFEAEASFVRGSYLPFGAGPRACVGRSFALLEGTILLAMLLARYRLKPIPGAPEVEMEAQISLHPKGGLRLAIETR